MVTTHCPNPGILPLDYVPMDGIGSVLRIDTAGEHPHVVMAKGSLLASERVKPTREDRAIKLLEVRSHIDKRDVLDRVVLYLVVGSEVSSAVSPVDEPASGHMAPSKYGPITS